MPEVCNLKPQEFREDFNNFRDELRKDVEGLSKSIKEAEPGGPGGAGKAPGTISILAVVLFSASIGATAVHYYYKNLPPPPVAQPPVPQPSDPAGDSPDISAMVKRAVDEAIAPLAETISSTREEVFKKQKALGKQLDGIRDGLDDSGQTPEPSGPSTPMPPPDHVVWYPPEPPEPPLPPLPREGFVVVSNHTRRVQTVFINGRGLQVGTQPIYVRVPLGPVTILIVGSSDPAYQRNDWHIVDGKPHLFAPIFGRPRPVQPLWPCPAAQDAVPIAR